ncbi:hypothetical protein M878_29710 [Streptomyces roseochromogenus subsp. oscitans DS 12.976]|uniref:Uncharacterized protein n=2 Tax=Streptomyces roseochromogenus TaxID=285450 RepID=V6JYS9_STRRC|nr:hypothetical protein M878_29710 [Streptomyces roseochromogenus subsp. oscitans DS 12.976]
MGLIIPGLVVITAAFIGHLVGGATGALVATAAIFIPIYLGVVVPGRWFVRHRYNPQLKAFVTGLPDAIAIAQDLGACLAGGARSVAAEAVRRDGVSEAASGSMPEVTSGVDQGQFGVDPDTRRVGGRSRIDHVAEDRSAE